MTDSQVGKVASDHRSLPSTESDPTKDLRRLHWTTVFLPFVERGLAMIVPAFVATFFIDLTQVIFFLCLWVLTPIAVLNVLRYVSFRYALDAGELVIKSGLVFRRERRIPVERVQDTELKQTVIRRLLGLGALKVTTAGAEAEEAALDVVTRSEGERLRREISIAQARGRSTESADISDREPKQSLLCASGLRELIVGGVTSNFVAGLGAVLGTFFYLSFFRDWGGGRWGNMGEGVVREFLDGIDRDWLGGSYLVRMVEFFYLSEGLIQGLVFAFLGAMVSVLGFVVRYYGFQLTERAGVLTRVYGLFTVRRSSLSQNKIQALKLEEGLLRRLFGLVAVRADSAGDRQKVDENKKKDVLIPVIARERLFEIMGHLQPSRCGGDPEWRRVSRLAIMRGTRLGSLLVVLAIAQSIPWLGWFSLSWFLALPLIYGLNWQWYRHAGYVVETNHLLWRWGWVTRNTLYLPIGNIQNISLTRFPFDRRLGLASVTIDTAGQSNTGGGAVIRNLPLKEARALQSSLVERVARGRFVW